VYALFTRLERYVFPALVTLALWVAAMVVAVPAVAQAQEKAPNNKASTRVAAEQHVVVVDPGDTLWSISSEELGPDAAPWRVARGVERLYALNREQIGPDPNVIFAGQRLSVPLALSGPPASQPSASQPSASQPSASQPSASQPSASGRSAGTEPPVREAAKAASAGNQASRQAKHETLGAPRQASKPAPLPDAAQAAPVPASRPLAAEEPPPRSPGESFVDRARAAVAAATSALVELLPRGDHSWRELLGAALLAMSSVAAVLTVVLALALLLDPGRAKRAQRGAWWREVRANERAYGAYERASFDPFPANGAHASGARANGNNVPVGTILTAERKRGRLRRRGRPRSPDRHVRKGLAHGAYGPGIRHLLRGASGHGSRRPASRVSAASPVRTTAAPSRTGVGGR
jgi:LysM repeat protein